MRPHAGRSKSPHVYQLKRRPSEVRLSTIIPLRAHRVYYYTSDDIIDFIDTRKTIPLIRICYHLYLSLD